MLHPRKGGLWFPRGNEFSIQKLKPQRKFAWELPWCSL